LTSSKANLDLGCAVGGEWAGAFAATLSAQSYAEELVTDSELGYRRWPS
jgi:hypothetical protein